MKEITIHTDGGYKSSIELSAWAWVRSSHDDIINYDSGAIMNKTNQQMEMQAVIESLRGLTEDELNENTILIHSDSAYICNCFKDKWWAKWVLNGWKNSKGDDVANKELWQSIIDYYTKYDIRLIKVKGHSDNKFNNYADMLVNKAYEEYQQTY